MQQKGIVQCAAANVKIALSAQVQLWVVECQFGGVAVSFAEVAHGVKSGKAGLAVVIVGKLVLWGGLGLLDDVVEVDAAPCATVKADFAVAIETVAPLLGGQALCGKVDLCVAFAA